MSETFIDISNVPFEDKKAINDLVVGNAMSLGSGSQVFRGDQSGIWLGAEKYADAPFKVSMAGAVTMTSATITGYVADVGGTYDSSASGARVRILPDANTGIQIIDDAAGDVFVAYVGGASVGDVAIGNYAGGNGMLWDKSASTLKIKGNIEAGSISGVTITGVTITGSSISTGTTGTRVEMAADGDAINIYDAGNGVGLTLELITAASANIESKDSRALTLISASGAVEVNDNLDLNGNDLQGASNIGNSGSTIVIDDTVNIASGKNLVFLGTQGSINCGSISCDAVNVNSNDVTSIDELRGNDGYIDMNSGNSNTQTHHFDPSSSDTYNLGGSSRYWSYLNVKEIAKQGGGGFGVYDGGVKMQDGSVLSDTEALLYMKPHETKKTDYGKPIYDLSTIPADVLITPEKTISGDKITKDKDGRYWGKTYKKVEGADGKTTKEVVQEEHFEGERVFAMMSIMIGAIRELTLRVKELETSTSI